LQVYDIGGFIEPRRAILTDGSLVDFCEQEVSEETNICGNIAHRLSRYAKAWVASGAAQTGGGTKSMQFVRTAAGWKIASLIWDDD
jgi:hypothetical protein